VRETKFITFEFSQIKFMSFTLHTVIRFPGERENRERLVFRANLYKFFDIRACAKLLKLLCEVA
jgi:hypothetical protein